MAKDPAVRRRELIVRQVAIFAAVGPPVGSLVIFFDVITRDVVGALFVAVWSYLLMFPVAMAIAAGLATALVSSRIYRQRAVNPLIHVCIGGACGFVAAFLLALSIFVDVVGEGVVMDRNVMVMARCGFYGGCISALLGWACFLRASSAA